MEGKTLIDEFAALRGTSDRDTRETGPPAQKKKRGRGQGRGQGRGGHTADSAKIDAALGNAQKAVALISKVPALVEEKVNEVFGEESAKLPGWWKGQLSQARSSISALTQSKIELESRVSTLEDKVTWLENELRAHTDRLRFKVAGAAEPSSTEAPTSGTPLENQLAKLQAMMSR